METFYLRCTRGEITEQFAHELLPSGFLLLLLPRS